MLRSIAHGCVATVAMWIGGAVSAQDWDVGNRAADVQRHFHRDWNDGHFDRRDPIDRTLNRGADPLRSNFGLNSNGFYGPVTTGVQNYGSPNYFNHFYGTPFGGEAFPGQWYYQNRRYINPYGGLNQYPSDRYFTR